MAHVFSAVSALAGRLSILGPTPAAIKLIDWADKTTTNKVIELLVGTGKGREGPVLL